MSFSLFAIPWAEYMPQVLVALGVTMKYTVVSFICAIIVGLLAALARSSKVRVLRWVAAVYTEFFKNIPLLVIIFVIYFGLPTLGLKYSAFVSGSIGLVLFYGSYLSEIFRSAITGVDPGQGEAAQALGMKRVSIFVRVVGPQALRSALPGMNSYLVDLLKSTSLLVTISAGELMSQGQLIAAKTFQPLEVYIVVAALYFAVCYPLSQLLLLLERKVRRGDALFYFRKRRLKAIQDERRVRRELVSEVAHD